MVICVCLDWKAGLGMEPGIPRKQGHVVPSGKGVPATASKAGETVCPWHHIGMAKTPPPGPCCGTTMYRLEGSLLSSKEGLSMAIVCVGRDRSVAWQHSVPNFLTFMNLEWVPRIRSKLCLNTDRSFYLFLLCCEGADR